MTMLTGDGQRGCVSGGRCGRESRGRDTVGAAGTSQGWTGRTAAAVRLRAGQASLAPGRRGLTSLDGRRADASTSDRRGRLHWLASG